MDIQQVAAKIEENNMYLEMFDGEKDNEQLVKALREDTANLRAAAARSGVFII